MEARLEVHQGCEARISGHISNGVIPTHASTCAPIMLLAFSCDVQNDGLLADWIGVAVQRFRMTRENKNEMPRMNIRR